MWHFASNAIAGSIGLKNNTGTKPALPNPDCSDDDASSSTSREEGLECPICWESFNIVENVPYVLWCGHTLCKNCVLGLQSAVVKLPTTPIQLPLFINCPWCHLLSLRLVYRGSLKFPRKNFFLLWMVESMNSDRPRGDSPFLEDRRMDWPPASGRAHHHREGPATVAEASYLNMERINFSLRKSVAFFVNLTAKFPLVIIFLLIVIYAIPASAAILALYLVVTVLFALPSFLILYFAYPSLDWLVREIVT